MQTSSHMRTNRQHRFIGTYFCNLRISFSKDFRKLFMIYSKERTSHQLQERFFIERGLTIKFFFANVATRMTRQFLFIL